jgi:hypothetical protein
VAKSKLFRLKKLFFAFVACVAMVLLLVVVAVGAAGYYLTRPLPANFATHPNAAEAHEANRKLKLLNEAQSSRKQGFVRFSEVEINSFLDKYNSSNSTNGPVQLVKAGVFLGDREVNFVTWHSLEAFGYKVPFVWQRVLTPIKQKEGWSFAVRSMKVGAVEIPAGNWAKVEEVLGTTDALFAERKEWLKTVPMVQLAQNELSETPEVRLYTYLPKENSIQHEAVSE